MNQVSEAVNTRLAARRKRHRAAGIAGGVLVIGALLVWRCWPHAAAPAPAAAVPVNAGQAVQRDFPVRVQAVGSVQPVNVTDVKVRVDGQLARIAFTEGQDVKAGQMLAQLDQGPLKAQLDQASATLGKDAATLRNAQLDLQRYVKLAPIGAATQQAVDAARAKVDESQAAVAADRALVQSDRLQLGFTTLVAPFDGRTGAREASLGAIVHPTDATGIVTVTQMAPIDVQFSVPQDVLPALLAGQQRAAVAVDVTPQAGGAAIAHGTLRFIDSRVDAANGQVLLKARFGNADRALWPGQFVNASVLLRTEANQVAVPANAIMHTQDGDQLYVVAPDGTVALRPVKSGVSAGGMTAIASGLKAGETVVFDGQSRLNPGARVALTRQSAQAAAVASATVSTDLP
ncbi:efflux RND transporter periplasmic adaptor subunit [Paraburkholderia acidisoli]|uniref:Efflux RND transporter periplasmic adaptor subunit n=1 Tax=Paraburkholderia acidisoli TaxID=2571748 RepID=A0A7Z2GQ17_9BURK|nr:efflux RND transporter periplasmic adaptor subunit [Paraburkholderia acidisoli]QGZ65666.1 efflux RND transporter periplasmic adaptor subunit [Paraburkholderia acidisoli]